MTDKTGLNVNKLSLDRNKWELKYIPEINELYIVSKSIHPESLNPFIIVARNGDFAGRNIFQHIVDLHNAWVEAICKHESEHKNNANGMENMECKNCGKEITEYEDSQP